MITVEIDELTNCLVDSKTGEEVETYVEKVTKRNGLRGLHKSEWYQNWQKLFDCYEIYVLKVKGDPRIQGIIAIEITPDILYFAWAVSAPWNNKQFVDNPEYKGVGGHLFAIACSLSYDSGFSGELYGFAANKQLYDYYEKVLNCEKLGFLGPYHFGLHSSSAKMVIERYTYEKVY